MRKIAGSSLSKRGLALLATSKEPPCHHVICTAKIEFKNIENEE